MLPVGEEIVVPLGVARTHREGSDLTIVTYGGMLYKSAEAAEKIADEDDAQIEVIDLRSIRPLDTEAIVTSVKKTGRLLIVHEAARFGGFAGEITAQVCEQAFEWLDAPIRRVTALDTPVPYAPELEAYYLPPVERVSADGPRVRRTNPRRLLPIAPHRPPQDACALAVYDPTLAGLVQYGVV